MKFLDAGRLKQGDWFRMPENKEEPCSRLDEWIAQSTDPLFRVNEVFSATNYFSLSMYDQNKWVRNFSSLLKSYRVRVVTDEEELALLALATMNQE